MPKDIATGVGIFIACVFVIVSSACTSQAHASNVCSQVHSEMCAKAVASGIQRETGSRKIACYYEHLKADRMMCYVFRAPWKGTMIVRVVGNRWHVLVIVMPDNTRKDAPLSGRV